MKELKIRSSCSGKVMVNNRANTDMGETAKDYIRELWIENTFGRTKDYSNKYIRKGIMQEEASITLLSNFDDGKFYRRNEKPFENDFITGVPDLITDTHVIDIKTSWDIFSFFKADISSLYEWQLRSYMVLTGRKEATLCYCLVDTPESEVEREAWRIINELRKDGIAADLQEVMDDVRLNWSYDKMPIEYRVRKFHISHDDSMIEKLYTRIEKCREYYRSLSLTPALPGVAG